MTLLIPTDQYNNTKTNIYTFAKRTNGYNKIITNTILVPFICVALLVSFNIICVVLHYYFSSFDLFNYRK